MTQALISKINDLQNMSMNINTQKMYDWNNCKSKTNFDTLYQKQAFVNNSHENRSEHTARVDELTEKLKKTTKEIAVEDSLDLTLAKDFIDTIRSITAGFVENKEEIAEQNPVLENEIVQNVLNTNNLQEFSSEQAETECNIVNECQQDILNNNELDLINVETNKSNLKLLDNEPSEQKTLKDLIEEEKLEELNIESIETSCEENLEEGSTNDYMPGQTIQEQGVKAMLSVQGGFDDKLILEKAQAQNVNTSEETNPSKILEQITKQMDKIGNGSKVNIVLNPESLGKVSLQIINTKEGLSAQFTVATQEAREQIMKGMDSLKETLLSQGISVDEISVKLSETQESEYQQEWTEQDSNRGGNKQEHKQNKEQKDKNLFANLLDENKKENNG